MSASSSLKHSQRMYIGRRNVLNITHYCEQPSFYNVDTIFKLLIFPNDLKIIACISGSAFPKKFRNTSVSFLKRRWIEGFYTKTYAKYSPVYMA